jgi:PAS domain S-box-containing protein
MTETVPRKTILLVEDEALIAMNEAAMLKKHGFDVLNVHNAEKAIDTVKEHGIDLILMDIDLGHNKMLGTEAAEIILKEHDVPIVFLTSHAEKEYVDKVKKITNYGYVLKNSGEFVFKETIEMAFSLFESKQRLKIENEKRKKTEDALREEEAELTAIYKHTPVLMIIVDRERRVRKANSFAAEFAGSPEEELIGKRGGEALRCIHHLDDPRGCGFGPYCEQCKVRRTVTASFDKRKSFKKLESKLPFFRDGSEKELTFLLSTSYLEIKEEPLVIVSIEDITVRKRLEESLRDANRLLEGILDGIPDIIGIQNPDHTIVRYNKSGYEALGMTRDEVVGRPCFALLGKMAICEKCATLLSLETKKPETVEQFVPELGRHFLCLSNPILDDAGEVSLIVEQLHDITERKQAEDALRESEERFKNIFKESPIGIGFYRADGHVIEMNEAFLEIFGIPNAEEVKDFNLFQDPNLTKEVKEKLANRENIRYEIAFDFENIKQNNLYETSRSEAVYLDVLITPLAAKEENDPHGYLVQVVDINDRKQAEKVLRKSEELLNVSQQLSKTGGWEWCLETQTIYWTEETYRIHDFAPDEMKPGTTEYINRSVECYDPEDRAVIMAAFQRCLDEGQPYDLEFPFTSAKGRRLWIRTIARPIFEHGKVIRVIGNIMDITERKQNEEKLRKALEQKNYLMQELNHRVKNNLNMVSSLIKLKDSALGAEVDLSDLDNRINAISLVHEKLYQTEDISHINLKEYIHELNENVFSLSKRHVKIEEHIDDITLSTKTAIPVGLIINELATNAMKHGFTAEGEAVFSVELTEDKTKNLYILKIFNTGKPFPKDVTLDNPGTLGLQLITALVSQLQGTIELQRSPHPVFSITFPTEKV